MGEEIYKEAGTQKNFDAAAGTPEYWQVRKEPQSHMSRSSCKTLRGGRCREA